MPSPTLQTLRVFRKACRHSYVQSFKKKQKKILETVKCCTNSTIYCCQCTLHYYLLSARRYLFPVLPRGKDNISLHPFCMSPGLFLSTALFGEQNYITVHAGKTVESRVFSPLSLQVPLPKGNLIILFHGKCKIT